MSVRAAIFAGLMLAVAGGGCASHPLPVAATSLPRPATIDAWDAKWSNYGPYLQKLIESVQVQWERILVESRVYPSAGSSVSVKFRLDRQGRIAEILVVEGNAGTQGEKACVAAITSKAPYGAWTDPMVATLGESQEMTFTFYYQ